MRSCSPGYPQCRGQQDRPGRDRHSSHEGGTEALTQHVRLSARSVKAVTNTRYATLQGINAGLSETKHTATTAAPAVPRRLTRRSPEGSPWPRCPTPAPGPPRTTTPRQRRERRRPPPRLIAVPPCCHTAPTRRRSATILSPLSFPILLPNVSNAAGGKLNTRTTTAPRPAARQRRHRTPPGGAITLPPPRSVPSRSSRAAGPRPVATGPPTGPAAGYGRAAALGACGRGLRARFQRAASETRRLPPLRPSAHPRGPPRRRSQRSPPAAKSYSSPFGRKLPSFSLFFFFFPKKRKKKKKKEKKNHSNIYTLVVLGWISATRFRSLKKEK